MGRGDILKLLLPALILVLTYVLPAPAGLTQDGKFMLGMLIFAAALWITEVIPFAVTGLLVMVMPPLFGVSTATETFKSFGNRAVFFLIGAFILAAAIEKYGLHKRAALKLLKIFGSSPNKFVFGIMLTGALISFVMPEHGVVALLVPIIVFILVQLKVQPRASNFGKTTMIGVTYGCSIGSLGTLVGGARNPLTIGFLQETANIRISFLEWMIYSVPIVFISLPIVWWIMVRIFPPEFKDMKGVKQAIEKQVDKEKELGPKAKIAFAVLIFTIVMWVLLSNEIGLAVIGIIGAVLLFFTRTLTWEDVESKVPWGVILLYGGAITLGVNLTKTGAAEWLASQILQHSNSEPMIIIFLLITLTIILTEFLSNTVAVAVMLPIGLGLSQSVAGLGALASSLSIALSGGLAFVFVVATPGNLLAYTSGYFSQKDLIKCGLPANIICLFVLFAVVAVYWKILGVW